MFRLLSIINCWLSIHPSFFYCNSSEYRSTVSKNLILAACFFLKIFYEFVLSILTLCMWYGNSISDTQSSKVDKSKRNKHKQLKGGVEYFDVFLQRLRW